ncbi:MAG: VanZ family protein [Rikenellaceae bacterium]
MTKAKSVTAATIAYTVVLTTLCLVPISAPTPNLQVIGFDKLVHIGLYFGLNVLLISTIIARRTKATATQIAATTMVAIAYGTIIEFVQQQVGRDFDIYDIAANSLGAIIAAIIICLPQINGRLAKYLSE